MAPFRGGGERRRVPRTQRRRKRKRGGFLEQDLDLHPRGGRGIRKDGGRTFLKQAAPLPRSLSSGPQKEEGGEEEKLFYPRRRRERKEGKNGRETRAGGRIHATGTKHNPCKKYLMNTIYIREIDIHPLIPIPVLRKYCANVPALPKLSGPTQVRGKEEGESFVPSLFPQAPPPFRLYFSGGGEKIASSIETERQGPKWNWQWEENHFAFPECVFHFIVGKLCVPPSIPLSFKFVVVVWLQLFPSSFFLSFGSGNCSQRRRRERREGCRKRRVP